MGILTDREHTPATIASRMLDYGYNDYTMYIGEHLGHPAKELIRRMTLEEAAAETFEYPNCLILTTGEQADRGFGDHPDTSVKQFECFVGDAEEARGEKGKDS